MSRSFTTTRRWGVAVVAALALGAGTTSGVVQAEEHQADQHDTVFDGRTSLAEIVSQIGADEVWAAGYTGEGIDVAVIDTGVAPVPELITQDVFIGPDLSFEGGIDDVAGLDTYGHGTHLVGIIAARTPGADPLDPQPGDLIGVAPDARIVSLKVADNSGAADVTQVIAAIDWVVQHRNHDGLNIRVLNLAYTTPSEQSPELDPLSKAIENAWNHGIVVVAAGGNEGRGAHRLANPSTNPTVIAVGSAEWRKNEMWKSSKWSPSGDGERNVDLLAPGDSVMSLRVPGSYIDLQFPDGRVDDDERLFLGSGTSQATAVVSGAAALVLQQRPELTPDEVKALLISSATELEQSNETKGDKVIDLAAAMHADVPADHVQERIATGLGSLADSRGEGHPIEGEITVTGDVWDPVAWIEASESGTAWNGTDVWTGSSWSGSSWSGSSWSGSSWSGQGWSGQGWSGQGWSGSSWSGSSWSGQGWSGQGWSGSSWSGSSWSGSSWS